ncbi:MAG TPA: sugar phosphate isomerase/epimerase [Tepidisphaeraceae bacterium]|nr:sugar phosphate isomerase/epimerase [Tepidisphaeraceae bacterium]
MQPIIAFNTANLVAWFSGFRFKLSEWGVQEKLSVEGTTSDVFDEMCRAIRQAGYRHVEIWKAHLERCADDPARVDRFARILADHQLTPVALGGTLNATNARLCKAFNISACCGGYWGTTHEEVAQRARDTGIRFNFENHPEKSADEIRRQINYGADGLAVCVDTGWLATQGLEVPPVIRALGRLVRHVHFKDIASAGGHDCVPLGTGIVDFPEVVRELRTIGYEGVISWEDEPENRNPLDIAARSREFIERLF